MILDIGCGASPIGNVNLDLFYRNSPHTHKPINPRNCQNFVIGDANVLPFRSDSFNTVHAAHLIEHLLIPTNCIDETRRVTRKYAIFKVPNNPPLSEYHEHLYSWSLSSLRALLSKYFPQVTVRTNTNLENFQKRTIYKILNKIFPIERASLRFLSKTLAVELLAVCIKEDVQQSILDTIKGNSI